MRHGTLRSIAPWVLAALAHLPTLPLEAKQVLLKLGGEQQVNVQFLGDQYSPAIAADGQGNYVVIWLGPEVQSLFESLRAWRAVEAKAQRIPPYVIFHDTVLRDIAAVRPASIEELGQVKGVGASKLQRYGAAVLGILGAGD